MKKSLLSGRSFIFLKTILMFSLIHTHFNALPDKTPTPMPHTWRFLWANPVSSQTGPSQTLPVRTNTTSSLRPQGLCRHCSLHLVCSSPSCLLAPGSQGSPPWCWSSLSSQGECLLAPRPQVGFCQGTRSQLSTCTPDHHL